MKIDDLVTGKDPEAEVDIGGISVPVRALTALSERGYEHIRPYKTENTVSAWGKTSSGCFTQAQIYRIAG
jgi:hypothetical protein